MSNPLKILQFGLLHALFKSKAEQQTNQHTVLILASLLVRQYFEISSYHLC